MPKRSLYQCSHARVKGDHIYCDKGHKFSFPSYGAEEGKIHIRRLIKGSPLTLGCCQTCEDFDEMGPPIKASERGWHPTDEEFIRLCGKNPDEEDLPFRFGRKSG